MVDHFKSLISFKLEDVSHYVKYLSFKMVRIMEQFLYIEYEQCINLMKYYDERYQSLVKFGAGLSSAVPSLFLAVFQIGNGLEKYLWEFTAIISGVTVLGLLSIYTVIVQTRLYFIYPARQINSIRSYALESRNLNFANQMYLNSSFSAFKWFSSHTLLNVFIALQIGIFSSLMVYSLFSICLNYKHNIYISTAFGFFLSMTVFAIGAYYLHFKSKKHPDISIHGQKEGK